MFIKNFKFKEILFTGVASSVCFFIVTNFGVWALSTMYEKSYAGLLQSYMMGLPFFHNTVLSTLIYLTALKLIINFSIKTKIVKISL